MTKFIKYTFFTLLTLIILFAVAAVILVKTVNPNDLKGPIAQQVKELTGRQLTMNGNITWSLFPWVGIHIHDLTLANPSTFDGSAFASLKEADLTIRLLPLISGKFELGNLVLKGVTVNMVKNADGKNNWQMSKLQNLSHEESIADPTPVKITQNKNNDHDSRYTLAPLALTISSINISNADINYKDLKTKESYAIHNLNLNSKNISLHTPFSLALSFDFNSKDPNVYGRVDTKTDLAFDFQKQTFNLSSFELKAHLNGKNLQKKGVNINLNAKSLLNLKTGALAIHILNGQIANLQFQSNISGKNIFDAPQLNGTLEIPTFDPEAFINHFSSQASNSSSNKSHQMTLKTNLSANKNSVMLNNLMVTLDKSNMTGTISLLNPKKGVSTFNLSMDQIAPLFKLASGMQKIEVTGSAKISGKMTTSTSTSTSTSTTATPSIMQALKGAIKFNIDNGVIKGVDVGHQIDVAAALLNKSPMPQNKGPNETPFGSLTGTITMNNGIATNNNLLLQSPAIKVMGAGRANLVKQTINYGVKVLAAEGKTPARILNFQKQIGGNFPVKITGTFDHYRVYPDMAAIAKAYALSTVNNALSQQVQKILGGNSGKGAESGATTNGNLGSQIGKQINRIGGKGLQDKLKGLFQ